MGLDQSQRATAPLRIKHFLTLGMHIEDSETTIIPIYVSMMVSYSGGKNAL